MRTSHRTLLITATAAVALATTAAAVVATSSRAQAPAVPAPTAAGGRYELQVLASGREWLVLDTRTGQVQHWVRGALEPAGPTYEVTTLSVERSPGAGYTREVLRPARTR